MKTRQQQVKTLQNYVFGLSCVIGLLFLSFPVAYWRVSRSEKFAGLPMKSLQPEDSQKPKTIAEKTPEKPQTADPAVSTPASNQIQLLSPEKQAALKVILYETIDRHWQNYPQFAQSLLYRVDVNYRGDVIAYNPLTQAAKTNSNEIPLSQLVPSEIQSRNTTPHGQYTVIFYPNGVLEVDH